MGLGCINMRCFFISDLHGKMDRFEKMVHCIEKERPDLVLMGGDLLPEGFGARMDPAVFLKEHLFPELERLGEECGTRFTAILGNDDPRFYEELFREADQDGILDYVHFRTVKIGEYFITGYSYVIPSRLYLKDWEKYDVSHYTGQDEIAPDEGSLTIPRPEKEAKQDFISQDLEVLAVSPPEKTIYLFHCPPHETNLDRADNDGKMIDWAPLPLHVGSFAIKRFIQKTQPLVTLHGHIHMSARIMGTFKDLIGKTHAFSGAHEGKELALVRFDTDNLEGATRVLI